MRWNWQPIITAPKDTEILLAGQWLSGKWDIQMGKFLASRWPYVGQGQPTHWQPLPFPPTN